MMPHLAIVMSAGRTSQFPFQTSQIRKQTNWNLRKTFKPRINLLSFDPVGDSNFNVVCHLCSFLSLYLLILIVQGGGIALCALLVPNVVSLSPKLHKQTDVFELVNLLRLLLLMGFKCLTQGYFLRTDASPDMYLGARSLENITKIYLYDKALFLDHLIFYIFLLFLITVYT